MSDTSRANIMSFMTIFTWLLICYNHTYNIILVTDRLFTGFLTNNFSAHMVWNFEIGTCGKEGYLKTSFQKVIRDWLFKCKGTNKSFYTLLFLSFTSFSFIFLSFSFSLIFFYFCFRWTWWIHFRKSEVESAHRGIKSQF